jgi:FixJ family two-component response regulator
MDARTRPAHARVRTLVPEVASPHPAATVVSGEIVKKRRPRIAIVDDDESLRESLPHLLALHGYESDTFASAEAFLRSKPQRQADVLLLDLALPGMSGADLQQELVRRHSRAPIVFITAQGDEPSRARLLAAGARACLFKPFSEEALIDALRSALSTGEP